MDKLTVWLLYDADTALGINNEGELVFPYDLEDTDVYGTKDVYNGKDSVLWNNLRQTFRNEIRAMYQELRHSGALSYDKVEKMFEDHQDKWPEAIFNEDAWFKYLAPLVEKGNASYLTMLQGSKESQRKWWLYNRFKYIDSKYNAGDALTDFIELRGYAKADITVTPYASIYPTIKYGQSLVQQRGKAGQSYTLPCPLDSMNDTEIAIYSASQIKSVGDLSPLLVGRANFSSAVKIQDIKLGSGEEGYSNGNLTYLSLGNNSMLKTLDVRNCPALTDPIDASHCTNLETALFEGSSITGFSAPNGGVLKTLHLPSTLTNLTILNQKQINDFSLGGYDNLTTVRLENVPNTIPEMDILNALQSGSRVRLIGFEWRLSKANFQALAAKFKTFRGLNEYGDTVSDAVLYGIIHISETIHEYELESMRHLYPDLTIDADSVISFIEPSFDTSDAYVVQWDYSDPDTKLYRSGLSEYVDPVPADGNDGSGHSPFDNVYPWSEMKMYNVEDGVITVSQDDPAFSFDKDTVVKIPDFWYKVEKDTTTHRHTWAISPIAKEGYKRHPGSGKYIGRYHMSGSSAGVFSKTGSAPIVNVTRANCRSYGKAKGTNWRMLDAATWGALQMLYLVEYADFYSQNVLGKGLNTNTLTAVGGTDIAQYHTVKATGAHNQYRYVEDMYSNSADWIDGFTASGRAAYVSTDPTNYADAVTGYTNTGVTMPASGWIMGFACNDNCDWLFIPSNTDSAPRADHSADHVTDYMWTDNSDVRIPAVGGAFNDTPGYGIFYFHANHAVSDAGGGTGSRLIYDPLIREDVT